MAFLELKNIKKFYDEVEVINNLSLKINDGEFCVLVGPSGCGKSTLLRMIAGLEKITGGDIFINDLKVNDISAANRGLAMVFQSYALYPHMSVRQNLAFGLENLKMKKDEINKRIMEATRLLRMQDYLQRKPGQLSGGQKQRVAIGRAIVREPSIYLFDEPLSNLDAALRVATRIEIANLHDSMPDATMVYVTHDQVEAMTLADRIIIMKDGYIEQIGSPIEVFSKPANVFVATFIGSPPMNIFSAEIINSNNNIKIKLDDNLYFDCTEDQKNKLQNKKNIFLGIRAEDIMPVDNNTNSSFWSFKRNVDIVEPLGTETQLFITINDKEIISRMYNPYEVNVGDELTFQVDPHKVHFFDKETEKAII